MTPIRVKLLWIEGEGAEEFNDLVGCTGSLGRAAPADGQGLTFKPDGHGDWLTIPGKLESMMGDNMKVHSRRTGLAYVFRKLGGDGQ
jgi:hypothetical protein